MRKLRDYLCTDCGKEFEKLVKDGTQVECVYCGSTKTTVQFSPNAIKVTGQGAYSQKMKV